MGLATSDSDSHEPARAGVVGIGVAVTAVMRRSLCEKGSGEFILVNACSVN